jgi:hypothetical protein
MRSGMDRQARFRPRAGAASASSEVQGATTDRHAPTLLLLREWLIAVSTDAHHAEVPLGGPSCEVEASGSESDELDPVG